MQNEYLTQPSARYIHALERLLMQVLVTETRKAQSGALIAGQEHSNLMQQQHCHLLCCSTVSAAVFTSVDQLLVQTKCDVAHRTLSVKSFQCVIKSTVCAVYNQEEMTYCTAMKFALFSWLPVIPRLQHLSIITVFKQDLSAKECFWIGF